MEKTGKNRYVKHAHISERKFKEIMTSKNITKIIVGKLLFTLSAIQAAEPPVQLNPDKYYVRLSTRSNPSSLIETPRTNMANQAPIDTHFRSEIFNVYIRNNQHGDCFTPEMVAFLKQFDVTNLTIRCDNADHISFPRISHHEGWIRNLERIHVSTEAPDLNEGLSSLHTNMEGLTEVNLCSKQVTKEGIENIAKLPFLKNFILSTGRVTIDDDTFRPFSSHPMLKKITYEAQTEKGEEPALRTLYESREKTNLHQLRYVNGRNYEPYDFSPPTPQQSTIKDFFTQLFEKTTVTE